MTKNLVNTKIIKMHQKIYFNNVNSVDKNKFEDFNC